MIVLQPDVPGAHHRALTLSLVAVALLSGGRRVVAEDAASLTLPAETPLRVQIQRTIPLKPGQPFEGRLIDPVYGPDRLLLPAGLLARGVVAATPATDRPTRINARLDGDFTPLREPVIRLTQLVLPSGTVLSVAAEGNMRDTADISLAQHPVETSIVGQVKGMIHDQIKQMHDTLHDPHKGDRVRQMLYAQLPYHPQRVWAGSSFDAVLSKPLPVPADVTAKPLEPAPAVDITTGTMRARLTAGISSKAAKKGDPVAAVLTDPFCDAKGQMMLPAGTALTGVIVQARPARRFGRNGRLRFSFRSIATPATASTTRIDGNVSAIQSLSGQNVALDDEGGARAQPDKGRFIAPLVLVAMAAGSQDSDGGVGRQGVTSNGFGVPARILTMALASRNLSTGFAAFAFIKSVYRRYIARGHEVTFPRHTRLAIALGRH